MGRPGDYGEVRLDWTGAHVAVVTINRPDKRNACNGAAWRGLRDAMGLIAAQGGRLAVLTGAGGHFSAGDDIHDASKARETPQDERAYAEDIRLAFTAITEAPFPVIAAIQGYCIGGALSLAMCCDFRVGTASAQLGIPAAKLGFTYPAAQCARLMALVGISMARRMLFTGERIDGATAHAHGLLDQLADDPLEAALAFGAPMAEGAPLSVHASKRIFQALSMGDLAGQAETIAALMQRVETSDDLREGARAFAEKRQPRFRGA